MRANGIWVDGGQTREHARPLEQGARRSRRTREDRKPLTARSYPILQLHGTMTATSQLVNHHTHGESEAPHGKPTTRGIGGGLGLICVERDARGRRRKQQQGRARCTGPLQQIIRVAQHQRHKDQGCLPAQPYLHVGNVDLDLEPLPILRGDHTTPRVVRYRLNARIGDGPCERRNDLASTDGR